MRALQQQAKCDTTAAAAAKDGSKVFWSAVLTTIVFLTPHLCKTLLATWLCRHRIDLK
jgi:hypothetical protein